MSDLTPVTTHHVVTWHCPVLDGSFTSNVQLSTGYSTTADIPRIIATMVWGSNRNADLVVIDSIV